MADSAAVEFTPEDEEAALTASPAVEHTPLVEVAQFGGDAGLHYHMYAQDLNALPAIVYREWTVVGEGDFTAAQYTGPYSGASINFAFIVVLNTYVE